MKPLSPLSSCSCSRREFLCALAGCALAPANTLQANGAPAPRIRACGPASKLVPRIDAAFIRRKGDYGMLWPGAIYDGETALRQYRENIHAAASRLGLDIKLRPDPIYTLAETEAWLSEAKQNRPDGFLIVLLDRQEHAWPSAIKAAASGIPTVVFSPVGTSFTTNTMALSGKDGVFIASTSDFHEAEFGLKMLRARAFIREMRFIVIKGNARSESRVPHFGMHLRQVPAASFLAEYNATAPSESIEGMAREYVHRARRIRGATRQDVIAGIKSYLVASRFLEREEGDGITMDCLGALGPTQVSLPCIAWSRMLDDGIPAACEADIGAAVTQTLVQLLFDRPGFQQDPVAETHRDCLIGAHCSCPTRLAGFNSKPEPFEVVHHHGNRDAVPRTHWREGQRITIADVLLPGETGTADGRPSMVIGTGNVVENVAVPPAGGCVVSVMAKLDGAPNLLAYPGFHQLFFYGDFKRELLAYCRLDGITPVVA